MALLILFSPLLLSLVLFTMKGLSSRLVLVDMASFPVNYIKGEVRNILQPKDPIDAMGQKTYDSLPIISQDSLELASRHRVVLAISEVFYKFIKSANLLIILIFLGLWERKKKGFEASDWYLLYTFAALVMMSILYARQLYYFSTRHGLTLVLPFVYFAGIGLVFSTEIVRRTLNRITPGWTVLKRYVFHILTFSLVIIFLVQGLSARRTEKVNFKEMGFWLKERGYQGSVIMGGKKFLRLVFYADGEFLEMPNSWEKVVESINKKNVRVVVIDSCTIEQDCPGFYKNWQRTGLFLLQETKGEEEKCAIQIYGIY